MNRITILTLALLAIGTQAQGMYTKRGREIMAAKKAPMAANMDAQKAKIVLVPVSKPAPACSKEEYYNVRLPLINAANDAKKKVKALVAPKQPQAGVQQRTAVGKAVATLAPLAALGTLMAYDQGLLKNAALANMVQSIDMTRFAAFFKNSVLSPMINAGRFTLGRYVDPLFQQSKDYVEYAPFGIMSAYILVKNHNKMIAQKGSEQDDQKGYEQLGERAAHANEERLSGRMPYNAKNLVVKTIGIKREGGTLVLDDKN